MTEDDVSAEAVEIGDVILLDRVACRVEGSFIDGKGRVGLEVGRRWRYFHRGEMLRRVTP